VIPPRVVYSYDMPTRREQLLLKRDAMRALVRAAGLAAEDCIEAAVASANALHLRTAWRQTREAWTHWQVCYEAARCERECERELAAMEAS